MTRPRTGAGTVVVVGSIHRDTVYEVTSLPRPGETVLTRSRRDAVGGKGANQAMAAAAHQVAVTMVGAIGRDADGEAVLGELASRGIDTTAVVRRDAPTGRAIVAVDPCGENLILVDSGASSTLQPSDLDPVAHLLAAADVLVLQGEVPASVSAAAADLATGTVVLTPAPVDGALELTAQVDVLVPNVHEAEQLAGLVSAPDEPPLERARTALRHLGGTAPVVLLTVGAHGVLVCADGEVTHVPAQPTEVLDTTGAGDAFAGAVAAALARGRPLPDAVHIGVTYAAAAVRLAGATPPETAAT